MTFSTATLSIKKELKNQRKKPDKIQKILLMAV
jgi:hypothetical protein